ncbi:hypothetical protein PY254_01150 [Rhodanobacter sp. AS-Z3]|uniref:hypothetical protein n=1 Tax=Rhodanobacter sp. AS-Z3 TaxID=3031330 RepID=UPI002479AC37|nr:hypothetical protein [Rhodanobacter sp. AS-Z3]WEN15317.1 hypothetical protein PY254_01150 [Rhodanobacter sp. AS-Z3]
MKSIRQPLILAASLVALVVLGGCGKQQAPPAVSADATSTLPGTSASAMAPAPAAGADASLAVDRPSAATLQLGTSINANNEVTPGGDTFAPRDSIYASVETSGRGTLGARWTYQDGQTVHADSKLLEGSGSETTVFMISRPSGFPAGDYKVEISLDNRQVASKDFSIK